MAASLELAEAVGAGLLPLTLGGVSPPWAAWLLGRAIDQVGRPLWLPLKLALVPVAGELNELVDIRLMLLTMSLALLPVGVEAWAASVMLLLLMCEGGGVGTICRGEPSAALHSNIRPAVLSRRA